MRNNKRLLQLFFKQSLPLVFGILLLGIGATIVSYGYSSQSTTRSAEQQLTDAITYYDAILDNMDALSLMLGTNSNTFARLTAILQSDSITYNEYRESRILEAIINSIADSHPYIDGITIYANNSNDITLRSGDGFQDINLLTDKAWFGHYMEESHPLKSNSEPFLMEKPMGTEKVIRTSRPINNSLGTQIGVIVLDLKDSVLSSQFIPKNGFLNVSNTKGEILFSSPWDGEQDAKSIKYFHAESEKYGWVYTLGFSRKVLYALSTTILNYTLALTLIALILSLLIARKHNKKERQFLENLMQQLNQQPDADELDTYKDLFDYLNYHVIKVFIEQDYLRWQKEALEYRALQMQINPHFVFNTLDTINWKAIKLTGSDNDVSKMIQLLSKLLQYALRTDGQEGVPLEKELEQMKRFVMLQTYRFHDAFRYQENIDQEALGAIVPCMFLEPILENIFNHGFPDHRQMTIDFSLKKVEEKITITISDDGLPISEEVLKSLNSDPKDILKGKHSLGIANTKKRLQLFFHGDASMNIDSNGIQGVTVSMVLPFITRKN